VPKNFNSIEFARGSTMTLKSFVLIFVFSLLGCNVESARILGFFPHNGKSHFDVLKVPIIIPTYLGTYFL